MPVIQSFTGSLETSDIGIVHLHRDHATGDYIVVVDFMAGKEQRSARAIASPEVKALADEVYTAALAVAQAGLASLSE